LAVRAVKKQQPEPSEFVPISAQIREALSWKLVAEFHRRHPKNLTVIEAHPGGGQYDCLGLVADRKVLAYLNRAGEFTEMPRSRKIHWEDLWPKCLDEQGIGSVLDRMSEICGFSVPEPLPPTNAESLAYRIMAGLMSTLAFERNRWEWKNGQEDTAGYGNQPARDRWFEKFPGSLEEMREHPEIGVFGIPNYGFWFLLKDGRPKLCISKNAVCRNPGGKRLDLAKMYRGDHSLFACLGSVLGLLK